MICLFNNLIRLISLSSVLSQGIPSSVNGSIVCPDLRPKIQESSIILLFSSPFTQYISKFYWLFLLNTSYFIPHPNPLHLYYFCLGIVLCHFSSVLLQELTKNSSFFPFYLTTFAFLKTIFIEKFQVYKNIERKVWRQPIYLLLPHINSPSRYQHFFPERYICYNQ